MRRLSFNEWPEELLAAMMESRELSWPIAERQYFVTHVQVTRQALSYFDFEFSSSFRKAVPIFFFGWLLYMTELRQFHEFNGFPVIDQACGVPHED